MNANDDDNSGNETVDDFDRVGTDVAADERGNSFYSFCENNHKNWEWVQSHYRRDWRRRWIAWPVGQKSFYYIAVQTTSRIDDNESKKIAYEITILCTEIRSKIKLTGCVFFFFLKGYSNFSRFKVINTYLYKQFFFILRFFFFYYYTLFISKTRDKSKRFASTDNRANIT